MHQISVFTGSQFFGEADTLADIIIVCVDYFDCRVLLNGFVFFFFFFFFLRVLCLTIEA